MPQRSDLDPVSIKNGHEKQSQQRKDRNADFKLPKDTNVAGLSTIISACIKPIKL